MSEETNCILIHPEFSKNSSLNYVDVCEFVGAKYPIPPLGLMTVAALLPQNWNFKLIDLNVEPLLEESFAWADIVLTGGMLSQQPGIFSVIEKAHQYGKMVVVGGPEPTSQPELYIMADYLVLGEAENTIPAFLEDLKKGYRKGKYVSFEIVNMKRPIIPRYDLIRFTDYLIMGIQFSRGCPYNCEFCNVIELFGRESRTKNIDHVISELQNLYNLGYRGHIFFVDDNFLANGKHTKNLLVAIAKWSQKNKYPFYFAAEASINLAENDEFLQLMKEADFRFLSIGIETIENEILKKAQKHQNANKPIVKIVKKIFSYGIAVDASFILGFDNETDQSADILMKCIQDAGICMAMVGTLFALPNTQLLKRLKKEERLFGNSTNVTATDTEIDQMTSGLNFITNRDRKDILKDYIKTLRYLYNPQNYFKRLIYLGLNLNPANKHKPTFKKRLNIGKAFLKVCGKTGFNKKTGVLFWNMFFTILFRNPKATAMAVSFATMYIHLAKHSDFIITLTEGKIKDIEHVGEENYNKLMLRAYSEISPGI